MLNNAPAIRCSWGKANLAMNNDPAENTKSAPRTESQIAGSSKAQYIVDRLLKVNRRIAILVANDPTPETPGKDRNGEGVSVYGPTSQPSGTIAATNPTKVLHKIPQTNIGTKQTTVCIGEYFL